MSIVLLFFFQLCTCTTFEYPVHIFFHVEKQCKPYNFTELERNWPCKQSIPARFSLPMRLGYEARSGPALSVEVTGREFKGTETCGHAMIGKGIP